LRPLLRSQYVCMYANCVRVYARVLVPPNLYIHTYIQSAAPIHDTYVDCVLLACLGLIRGGDLHASDTKAASCRQKTRNLHPLRRRQYVCVPQPPKPRPAALRDTQKGPVWLCWHVVLLTRMWLCEDQNK